MHDSRMPNSEDMRKAISLLVKIVNDLPNYLNYTDDKETLVHATDVLIKLERELNPR